MSDPFAIRSYQKGNESQILELFNISYNGRHMSLPYWRWRFCDNPSGHGVIKMCWDHDMLAAHYAVTSILMSIEGRDYLSGLSGTTMTHPDYRGKGLFQILAKHTYDRMVSMDMPVVWGFPNSMIHRSRVRELNWVDIYEVPMLRFHLINKKVTSYTPKDQVVELFEADKRFDYLWARVRKDFDIITQHNEAYLNWRFFSNPIEKYRLAAYVENDEIKGYAVFKRYHDEIQVVDLLMGKADIEVGEKIFQFIISLAKDSQAQSVSLWLNVVHPFHHALEKMGFMPEGPVTYLGGRVLKSEFDRSFYDFRRWYFMMSDSDVF